MLPGENYLIKAASSFPNPTNYSTNSLPPLLEPPPTLLESQQSHQDHHPPIMQTLNQNQNPFLIHTQESHDLKTLINPLVSQCDLFPVNLSHPTSSFTNSMDIPNKDSFLLKPFMSQQDFTFKELSNAIAKQCKKEANFQTHFQLLSDGFGNMRWAEKFEENTNKYQSPFLFGLSGGGGMGIPSATVAGVDNNVTAMDAAAIDHVMSTEPAFRWW